MWNRSIHSRKSEPAEAFPCRTVRASGSSMVPLLGATEKKGLMKGMCVDLDDDLQETSEIRSGKRDIPSPEMTGESATVCQMDASVNISVRDSPSQSSSSKTSEPEN